MNEKIVIVDDDKANLDYLKAILHSERYKVRTTTNPENTIDLIKNIKPDLILLDIVMPNKNGYEICQELKKEELLRDIPVLFISGLREKSDIVKGFEAGGVDYVSKPFNREELIARIRTHLQLKRLREKLQEKVEENENLLRVLTHDLANQLSGIIGFTDIGLLKSRENQDIRTYFEKIKSLSDNSKELIGFIRQMIAMESGKLQIKLVPTKISKFLKTTQDTFENKLKDKNLILKKELKVDPEKTKILVEPISFQNSVLNNIISNAIKFSYPGSKILCKVEENEKGYIKIDIKDYGTGMKKSHLNNIFSTQKQTSLPGTKGEKGTGFGMPLIKKYIERYNGKIKVSSKHETEFPDKHGTTISIYLKKPE